MSDVTDRVTFDMTARGFRCHDGGGGPAAVTPKLMIFVAAMALEGLVQVSDGCACEDCRAMLRVRDYLAKSISLSGKLDVHARPAQLC